MKNFRYLLLVAFLGISFTLKADSIGDGKKLTFDRKKGNCLACHIIDDGELAGNAGPPLLAMKVRFPEKKDLFDKIWDSTKTNPDSFMPPFGKHGLLTKGEIDLAIKIIVILICDLTNQKKPLQRN